MSGETSLAVLLQDMRPELHARPYVFCCVDDQVAAALLPAAAGMVREAEGLTLIVPQDTADAAGLVYGGRWAGITLTVHSALGAVGFLAAISAALAAAGIAVNPLAGYYHDHLFVPWERRAQALAVLARLVDSGERS